MMESVKETKSDLVQRLVSHPNWGWREGMVTSLGHIVITTGECTGDNYLSVWWSWKNCPIDYEGEDVRDILPDIDHPATKGWLRSFLIEVVGEDIRTFRYTNVEPARAWELEIWDEEYRAATEGELYVLALLDFWSSE